LSGKARPYRSLYCYPWDVASAAQHGQRLQQLGMNGVTLAVSYHAGKFLRPLAGAAPRVIFPKTAWCISNRSPRYGERSR
jgi:hypothetical protein